MLVQGNLYIRLILKSWKTSFFLGHRTNYKNRICPNSSTHLQGDQTLKRPLWSHCLFLSLSEESTKHLSARRRMGSLVIVFALATFGAIAWFVKVSVAHPQWADWRVYSTIGNLDCIQGTAQCSPWPIVESIQQSSSKNTDFERPKNILGAWYSRKIWFVTSIMFQTVSSINTQQENMLFSVRRR